MIVVLNIWKNQQVFDIRNKKVNVFYEEWSNLILALPINSNPRLTLVFISWLYHLFPNDDTRTHFNSNLNQPFVPVLTDQLNRSDFVPSLTNCSDLIGSAAWGTSRVTPDNLNTLSLADKWAQVDTHHTSTHTQDRLVKQLVSCRLHHDTNEETWVFPSWGWVSLSLWSEKKNMYNSPLFMRTLCAGVCVSVWENMMCHWLITQKMLFPLWTCFCGWAVPLCLRKVTSVWSPPPHPPPFPSCRPDAQKQTHNG